MELMSVRREEIKEIIRLKSCKNDDYKWSISCGA